MAITPASRQFHAFLGAANRDRPSLEAFFERCCPFLPENHHLDVDLQLMRTGGIDLKTTEEDSDTRFVAVIRDHAQGLFRRMVVEVEPEEPWPITRLSVEPAAAPAGMATPRMSEAEALAGFGGHLEEEAIAGAFSGAVLVAKDRATRFSSAYGFQNRERGIPNGVDTRFRIASVTKAFTAVAVLQLAQRGGLSLSDPIGTYLPDYPDKEAAGRVTAHHLLTHTSGVSADILGFHARRSELNSLEDFVAAFGATGLEFEPGTRWAYSNYGYVLLGLLVERIAKQNYYDYVQQHVFEPAEMASSSFIPDESGQRDAIPYLKSPEGTEWLRATDATSVAPALPSGSAFSTVADLKRFADALVGHRLVDAAHYELLTAGKVAAGTLGSREAYGFEEFMAEGVRWFARSGTGISANGELRIYPDSGYVVIALANIGPPAAVHMTAFVGDRLPSG